LVTKVGGARFYQWPPVASIASERASYSSVRKANGTNVPALRRKRCTNRDETPVVNT
jgi:hypothetical protein